MPWSSHLIKEFHLVYSSGGSESMMMKWRCGAQWLELQLKVHTPESVHLNPSLHPWERASQPEPTSPRAYIPVWAHIPESVHLTLSPHPWEHMSQSTSWAVSLEMAWVSSSKASKLAPSAQLQQVTPNASTNHLGPRIPTYEPVRPVSFKPLHRAMDIQL